MADTAALAGPEVPVFDSAACAKIDKYLPPYGTSQNLVEIDALVRPIVDLGRFMADFTDEVQEVDLNPVVVHSEADVVTVVDALINKQGERGARRRAPKKMDGRY